MSTNNTNTTDQNQSSAMTLVSHVWKYSQEAIGHSWTRLNEAMWDAVNLAIIAGLKFDLSDFEQIMKRFRGHRWFGESNGENWYKLAVERRHLSACQSYEDYRKRKPFIFDGQRIYVGYDFKWQFKRVYCTSFSDDGTYLTACSYTTEVIEEARYNRTEKKIEKRFKITLEDLRKQNKAMAKLKSLQEAISVVAKKRSDKSYSETDLNDIINPLTEIINLNDKDLLTMFGSERLNDSANAPTLRGQLVQILDQHHELLAQLTGAKNPVVTFS